ncbi:MAG: hypothetical protein IKC80_09960 [Kiritimatiellae bacterium]|nr:hypothetical protein [Kiritimatiellia bacterium]
MKRPRIKFLVFTGAAWWPTWAVSEAQAISNVEFRMRQAGKFPVRSQFEVRRADMKEAVK